MYAYYRNNIIRYILLWTVHFRAYKNYGHRSTLLPPNNAYYIRERYRVYGDYDRVRRSVSRLMGFWRGCSGMNLTLPPSVVTATPDLTISTPSPQPAE